MVVDRLHLVQVGGHRLARRLKLKGTLAIRRDCAYIAGTVQAPLRLPGHSGHQKGLRSVELLLLTCGHSRASRRRVTALVLSFLAGAECGLQSQARCQRPIYPPMLKRAGFLTAMQDYLLNTRAHCCDSSNHGATIRRCGFANTSGHSEREISLFEPWTAAARPNKYFDVT